VLSTSAGFYLWQIKIMNILNSKALVGIHQNNSVDFVKSAFDVYNSHDVLVILKQANPGFSLKEERTPQSGGGWLDLRQDVIQENRPAQIVFTSGTEGAAKAILLSHQTLADVVIRLNRIMKVDETISEYIGIPVTYSFGFGRCRAVAAAGGRCFIPEHGFNPAELARMLAAGEINAISAVPTLWRTLLVQPEVIGEQGKKVKWIEIGSQYMSRAEKEKMKALFPNAIIVQHYGLTEASRTTFLNITETEGDFLESVGQATGDVEVKISPAGRIMIRGPHVASGQLVGDEIKGLVDADGWYTTGDFGRMENGFLYYEGRADDLINCAGVKINPDLLQERINRRLKIENKIAVSRIDDELRGDGFFVAIESGSGIKLDEVREVSFEEILALGVNAKSSIKVQEVKNIPRTDTGKVRRKELSILYSKKTDEKRSDSLPDKESSVLDIFTSIFPGVDIKPADTFRSLGGDSLNYIQMLMLLETHFGIVPDEWDKMSIESMENIERKSASSIISWLDTSVFLRVIAIMGVVATHSGMIVTGGGTMLLFVLIGYNMARFKSAEFIAGRFWQWLKSYAAIILIPYFIFMAMYMEANKFFDIYEILLSENLVNAKRSILFPFWFVQSLLQCLVLFGLVFSVPVLRRYASKSPVAFSFALLACLIAIRMIYPVFWDTSPLNDLVPLRFMAVLWLGWCFYLVENLRQKMLLCVIGIGFAFLDTGLSAGFNAEFFDSVLSGSTKWLVIGSILLAFFPRFPVPSMFKNIINDMGAATLYIFIFNGVIIKLLDHGLHIESSAIVFSLTMAVSLAVWWVMERLKLIARVQTLVNANGQKLPMSMPTEKLEKL
jgi:acyl-CoA synthetase (AMP-forming)/AMP-acid ligase II/acyl carrier protein